LHVVMVVKSDVVNDARVRREVATLAGARYRVTVIGDRPATTGEVLPDATIVWARRAAPKVAASSRRSSRAPRAVRWLLLPEHRSREERAFQRAARTAARAIERADVVHAHDLSALQPAVQLALQWNAALVYDAHECWTGRRLEGRPNPLRRRAERRLERQLGARADAIITVSEGIARWFLDTYGWAGVTTIHNSFPGPPQPADPRPPRGLLYAGRLDGKRDLDTVAAAAGRLPGLPITLIGPDDRSGLTARLGHRVAIEPPVGIDEIDAHYRAHGLALVTLSDGSLNHRLALPNKLFQSVRAGVPVVAADLPEIRRIVIEHGIGTLYRPGDADSLVAAIRLAVDRYPSLCRNVEVAGPLLSWEHDAEALLAIYERLPTRTT
jgi:glycogen synthase